MSPAFAFTALGNPNSFFDQLKRENMAIVGTQAFPDHHYFTESDLKLIEKIARESGAMHLLTTGKDAVKLAGLPVELPCFVLESEIVMDDPTRFVSLL
jgi:tetraacyldisaccharide 4'-kinase